MPEIGNPNLKPNQFRNIKMGNPAGLSKSKKKDLGKRLNKIAGIQEKSQFVDKKNHNKMGKDAFLKLLSNQLANQDPFKPVDQKKFAADLAQFSQLEQLTNMNTKFDQVFKHSPDQKKYMGASLLGKNVLTKGTSVKVDAKSAMVNLPFYLDKPAKNLMVRIFDSSNNLIQQIDLQGMGKGNQSLTWDLQSMDGTRAVNGDYHFEVRGWDEEYNEFKGETRATGKITGVAFEGDDVLLTIADGRKVYLRDVKSFSDGDGSAAAKTSPLKQMAKQSYNKVSDLTQ